MRVVKVFQEKLVDLLRTDWLALFAIKGKETILGEVECQPANPSHTVGERTAARCLNHVDLVDQRRTNIIRHGDAAFHEDGRLLTACQPCDSACVTAKYILKVSLIGADSPRCFVIDARPAYTERHPARPLVNVCSPHLIAHNGQEVCFGRRASKVAEHRVRSERKLLQLFTSAARCYDG